MDIADVVMLAQDQQANRWAADSAELMRWQGRGLLPRSGCRLAHMPLGNASVLVEYELLDDRCNVLQMLVNGSMVDAECYLHPKTLEAWEAELFDSHKRDERLPVAMRASA